jgi:hypothetical protein
MPLVAPPRHGSGRERSRGRVGWCVRGASWRGGGRRRNGANRDASIARETLLRHDEAEGD